MLLDYSRSREVIPTPTPEPETVPVVNSLFIFSNIILFSLSFSETRLLSADELAHPGRPLLLLQSRTEMLLLWLCHASLSRCSRQFFPLKTEVVEVWKKPSGWLRIDVVHF